MEWKERLATKKDRACDSEHSFSGVAAGVSALLGPPSFSGPSSLKPIDLDRPQKPSEVRRFAVWKLWKVSPPLENAAKFRLLGSILYRRHALSFRPLLPSQPHLGF